MQYFELCLLSVKGDQGPAWIIEPVERESVLSITHLVLTFRTPQGIVARSAVTNVNCQAEKSLTVSAGTKNSSLDFTSDGRVRIVKSDSSVKETATSSDYCLNNGVLLTRSSSTAICQCPQGYSGERCEVSACYNYCLHDGTCKINHSGLPTCVCLHGTNGLRCERRICSNYCMNGGICQVDTTGQPSCKCRGNFSGIRCEVLKTEQFGEVLVPIGGQDTSLCM